jgi:DNA-binding response OmpR family regulator
VGATQPDRTEVVMRKRETKLSPQPWPWPGHPRVLIEHAEEAVGMSLASGLRHAGYAVAVCPGPGRSERCPLAGDEGCEAAHGADVIVAGLGLGTPQSREVLEALRARCAGTPLVVEVAPEEKAEWAELLEGCEVVLSPVTPDELLAAVRGVLATEGERG